MARRILVGAIAALTVAVVVTGQLRDAGVREIESIGLVAGIAVSFTMLGALVLASVPGHPVGRMMTAAGLAATVELVALSWTDRTPLAWLAQWMWAPMLGLVFLSVLLFPTGAPPSSRWRPIAWLIVFGTGATAAFLAAAAVGEPRLITSEEDLQLGDWVRSLKTASVVVGLTTAVGYLAAVSSLAARWRRADGETRRQLACLIPSSLLLLLGLALSGYDVPGAWALIVCPVPIGMAVAILRYRLYDVDLIINRTIVWLLLTAFVVLAVAAIVWLLSDLLFPDDINQNEATLVATGLVVVTVEPLHRRVQHSVDHFVYGDRDDPYLVLARLGGVLRRTVDPTAVMPLVTETVSASLQVPYVAVELEENAGPVIVTEHGRPVEATETFAMVSHGERLGRLIVGRRSSGGRFSRRECRLLGDIAVQAGLAAEATRLNRDLQASRERLVAGREEERRRLRRDLHDGLGPAFAGMTMEARAALRQTPADSGVCHLLSDLVADLESSTAEMRQLVDELRPPALDHGLEAALRAECARFDSEALSTSFEADAPLAGLPAAVEVAAFRIVAEALTNVARHSGAETCSVRVHRDGSLCVDVDDDGAGLPAQVRPGVGLGSMRERAAELGGSCTVGGGPDGGTSVRLELPLGRARLAALADPS